MRVIPNLDPIISPKPAAKSMGSWSLFRAIRGGKVDQAKIIQPRDTSATWQCFLVFQPVRIWCEFSLRNLHAGSSN